jgi:hypothetical protein
MIVRADLDRPVAGIGDLERDRVPAGIERDLAVLGDDFARNHGRLPNFAGAHHATYLP